MNSEKRRFQKTDPLNSFYDRNDNTLTNNNCTDTM